MYIDNTLNGLFTGTSDGNGGWNYPTANQTIAIKFSSFYLTTEDLVSGGFTITSETGEADDFTVGNATAKVFTATFNDPDDLMDGLTWGDGAVYTGVVTQTDSLTLDSGRTIGCALGADTYQAGGDRFVVKPYGGTTRTKTTTGDPCCIVVDSTTKYADCYTTEYMYSYRGGAITENALPSGFMTSKYLSANGTCYVLGATGLPNGVWTVSPTDATKVLNETYSFVPMGTFDFSNIDTFGITFAAEAYDKMTLFDADATDWVSSLDFTTPETINDLISALMTEMGLTASISASAVNLSVSWSVNPITSYSVTYRQVLKWLAEAIGCNVRIGRTGNVEFYTISPTAVATIEPSTIIGNTRTKTRYSIPTINKVVCYNTLGAGYEVHNGVGDVPYYIVGNPFLDPSGGTAPLTALLGVLDDVPAYYPTALNNACADPRIDCGDVVNVRPIDGATDGSDDYPVLVMHQTLTWSVSCVAGIVSTGNQIRAIPESMLNTDLSSMVDSNPSAVVNKIMAKGITVYDSNNNVLFSAIGDDHLVEIAGFTVQNGKLVYETANEKVSMATVTGFTSTNMTNQHSAALWSGLVSVSDGSQIQEPFSALAPEQLSFGAMVHTKTASYRRDGLTLWQNNVGDATLDLTNGLHIDDNTNDVDVTPTGISISDGVDTTTFTAGIGKRVHSNTSELNLVSGTSMGELAHFDLGVGLWMVTITVRFNSNATGRRAINLSNVSGGGAYNSRWGNSSAATNGAYTYLHMASSIDVTTPGRFYINGYQNSGGNLGTVAAWDAVRVY